MPVKYPPVPMIGERIIHVDNPLLRKQYEEKIKETTQVWESESKTLRRTVSQNEAKIFQLNREIELVTRDRNRLANLKEPAAATVQPPMPAPDHGVVDRLKSQVGRLTDELVAAQTRLAEMRAQAAASIQIPQPPEKVEVIVEKIVEVKVRDWKHAVAAAAAGAAAGYAASAAAAALLF